jgi:predicted AAA+ superfamily ATPase
MHDVGLLGCVQQLDPAALIAQDYGSAKGFFVENFVAQEMRAAHETQEWPLYAWSEGAAEIEFVRTYENRVIPIEVKAGGRTKAKSLRQFQLKYQPPLAIKISANPLAYERDQKLWQLPLYLAGWSVKV